jgi:hypothetical protein
MKLEKDPFMICCISNMMVVISRLSGDSRSMLRLILHSAHKKSIPVPVHKVPYKISYKILMYR